MKSLYNREGFYSSIVREIRNLINENVLFTNEEGVVVASTDMSRIKQFHEGAYIAIKQKKKIIMTEEHTKKLQGVQKGVVIPIIIEEQPIGVIGITGDPTVVSPFAVLVQKVTELFVQDLMEQTNRERQARELEFFVFDWLNAKQVTESLVERSSFFSINMEQFVQVIIIKTNYSRLQLTYENIKQLKFLWGKENETLFIRWGQDKLLILTSLLEKKRLKQKLQQFKKDIYFNLKTEVLIGIGQITSYDQLYLSLEQAERACQVATKEQGIVFEDELKFDLLLHELSNETKEAFVMRTIAPLKQDTVLLETLGCWFENNMLKQETANRLHIHKNTLQYRLKRVEEITKLNVNHLQDLMLLYIGYRILKDGKALDKKRKNKAAI
ncbi:helix-turn-helix domain-containing protein [Caldibacillus lycopersici]|uniref:Helix-turn-helix domain-containing protein n=1 Tax=Perspicuibacillus lycopersici TaxID=1325689 RepID=A0AAE3LT49_9BACI|nr:sugar diacid recognition domain-containing protein [Perspicuibacillus lycopersici]MCU9613498.1 helix-turn-helix domain-containing protein [Perspicuibacillus lycopersici]